MDIQLELFPLSAVVGAGRPRPRPVVAEATDTDTPSAQADELPFDIGGVQEEAA